MNWLHLRQPSAGRAAIGLALVFVLALASVLASIEPTAGVSSRLKRYPYLTDLVARSVTVNWATDRSSGLASLKYGPSPNCTANTAPSSAVVRKSISIGLVQAYQWKATIDGLDADASYCYRVYLGTTDLLGADPSPVFRSQIAEGATTPFSFAVFGDWGQVDSSGTNIHQANLIQRIANSGVRFAVTTGDTAYPNGSQIQYGDLQQTGANTSTIFGPSFWTVAGDSIPLFNVQGNHGLTANALTNWPQDRAVATSGGRYQMDTYCCTNGTNPASYPSQWYAFTAGNARFYILTAAWSESNVGTATDYKNDYDNHWTSTSPEYLWLENDLESHPTAVKFAFWHYPLYSDNPTEPSDTHLRGTNSLEGLLARYGVDVGFNGHAHMYQRNLMPAGGLITYLTGGGGATLEPIGPCTSIDAYGIGWSNSRSRGSSCGAASPPTSIAEVFHFLKVTVDGTRVTVAPTNSIGQTFDVQTYDFGDTADQEPPTAPSNLSATAVSDRRVELSWTAATDNVAVTAYDVYRNGQLHAQPGNVTTYSDTAVTASTTYTYTVKARDAAGNSSAPSNAASVTTPPPPPSLTFVPTDDTYIQASAPTVTAGNATTLQVDNSPVKHFLVRFDVTGLGGREVLAARLRLYNTDPSPQGGDFYETSTASWSEATATWSNAPPASPPAIASLGSVSANSWYEVDLSSIVTGDGPVSLRVSSTSSDGANYASSENTVSPGPQLIVEYAGGAGDGEAPTAPTLTSATAAAPNRVELSWSGATDNVGVTGYSISRNGTPLSSVGNVQSFSDTTAQPGTAYTYTVAARDAAGNVSPQSNALGVTTPPAAPTNLTAIPGDGQITLSWSAPAGARTYTVRRALQPGGPYTETAASGLSGTSHVDSPLANGTTYYYVVTAVGAGAIESSPSNQASATPTSAPRTFVFSDDFETGNLSKWTSAAGLVVQSTQRHSGSWAAQGNTINGTTYAKKLLPATYADGFVRIYFYLDAGSISQVNLLRYRTASDGSLGYLYITPTRQLAMRNDVGAVTTASTTTVAGNAWHSLELHLSVSGTSSATEVWLDNVKVSALSFSGQNWGTTPIGKVQIGEVQAGRTYNVYFDDVAFDLTRIGTTP